jgi:FdhE protein
MTADAWLRAHPFLQPVARLHAQVEAGLSGVAERTPAIPDWDDYLPDHVEGIPLLRSTAAPVDLEPAAAMTLELIERLSDGPAREPLVAMAAQLARESPSPGRIVDVLLGEPDPASSSAGALRWLGWTAARRFLQPVLQAYGSWRQEDRWQLRHCPACGALPAMGQLIGVDPGFMRFVSCGCCGTRWRWRRTACPFCENDSHRLEVVKIESEPEWRLDHCESCRGYLKTYVGRGDESVMLADWTSLHLDVLARERGLERKAHSLYDLGVLLDAAK